LFQPLEEISRGLFAKNLTNTAHLDNYQQLAKDALDWLVLLVQFNIVLGSIFASFGTNYCRLLLQILFDKGNTDAVQALQFYCIYVPFMGINGITEAFVQAVGDSKIIQRQIWIFAACWIMFLISSYLFVVILDYGSVGLIMANIVNMTMRIMFSLQYIFSFYNAKGQTAVSFETFQFGNKLLWLSVVIGWAVMKDFDRGIGSIKDIIIHLGAGCVCFFIVFYLLYRYEKYRFASLFTVRKKELK
jgi:oligosaccharide translocation protein RFT1